MIVQGLQKKRENDLNPLVIRILSPDRPNLHLTPGSVWAMGIGRPSVPAESYDFGRFFSATIPSDDTGLKRPEIMGIVDEMLKSSELVQEELEGEYPTIATALKGVNIFVGGYKCVAKLTEKSKRKQILRAFCMADWLLSFVGFLGVFIPPLKRWAEPLTWVKVVVKIGSTVVECTFNARDVAGRQVLGVVERGGSAWLAARRQSFT